jgi:glycosyltransferase involved in cell wall biosynthesis
LVIAVNTRLFLKDRLEGIGWFSYESLKRITTQHPEHKFIFLFDRPYSEEFIFSSNVEPVVVFPPTRHPVLWYLWFEWALPPVLKKYKPDLFFSPDGWLSLSASCKSMNVMHDLNYIHYPQFIPAHVRAYYNFFFPRFAKKADRIATVSEFSKQDISKQYGIDPTIIDVVYNGANESFKPLSQQEQQLIRNEFTGGSPFFMFVGLLHPRKNLANLFYAFDKFKKSKPSDVKLLVVGEKKWWTADIREAYEGIQHKESVIFTGRMATEKLIKVVASSLAMTYVPFFEGFGIPILEAMKCDVPVITSNTTSMPEVSAGAAHIVDPHSIDSIADGMIKVYGDDEYRNSLIAKARIRRLDFSWDKTADKLWASMEKVLYPLK